MYQTQKVSERKPILSVSIHDCDVQVFCCGGKGGQNQNKVASGVRVIHRPSGARGECREERDQFQNKKRAFRRMAESRAFRVWIRLEIARRAGCEPIEAIVERAIQPKNLRIESKASGGAWVETTETEVSNA
jgi:hypothetical protein